MVSCNGMTDIRKRMRDERGRFARERPSEPTDEQRQAATQDALPDLTPAGRQMLSHLNLPEDVMSGSLPALERELAKLFDTPEVNKARAALKPGDTLQESIARLVGEGHDIIPSLQAIVCGLPSESFVSQK